MQNIIDLTHMPSAAPFRLGSSCDAIYRYHNFLIKVPLLHVLEIYFSSLIIRTVAMGHP